MADSHINKGYVLFWVVDVEDKANLSIWEGSRWDGHGFQKHGKRTTCHQMHTSSRMPAEMTKIDIYICSNSVAAFCEAENKALLSAMGEQTCSSWNNLYFETADLLLEVN